MNKTKADYANAVCAALYLYRQSKTSSREPWLDMLAAHDEWLKREGEGDE